MKSQKESTPEPLSDLDLDLEHIRYCIEQGINPLPGIPNDLLRPDLTAEEIAELCRQSDKRFPRFDEIV